MNETLAKIAAAVKSRLDGNEMGEFTVSARTTDEGAEYGSQNEPKKYWNITLIAQNSDAESDPEKYKAHIAERLSGLTPLAPYIEFKLPEPEVDHYKHLGEKVGTISEKVRAAGIEISPVYIEWFEEQAKIVKRKESATEYTYDVGKHAVSTHINGNIITAEFSIPSGINVEEAKKTLEDRKTEFLSTFARMAAKKLTQDPAEREKIAERIKTFDVQITSQSYDNWHRISMEIRSPEVLKAMKEPGGLEALGAEKQKELSDNNPLLRLKDGDGTPGNPADLKKSLARAIFFTGEKAHQPIPLFAKIAGAQDVKRAIEKSLNYAKALKPELAGDVDAVLNDPVFQQHGWGATKNPDGSPIKKHIQIRKLASADNYIEGQFEVNLAIPTEKLTEVLGQLAAMEPPAVVQQASMPAGALGLSPESTNVGAVTPLMQMKALDTALKQAETELAPARRG